jgi:replication factor C small subunit
MIPDDLDTEGQDEKVDDKKISEQILVDVMARQSIDEMWVDKYEPQTLGDIVGHKSIISALKEMVKSILVPHMIFAGPAGVGKTTAALCFARDILGDGFQDNFFEINASSKDRGIDFIREELVAIVQNKAINAPFKIVLLDEVDGMTKDAQNALRGTMKTYASNAVFILCCNYKNRVIDPIANSRCALFRFGKIDDIDIDKRLRYILAKENRFVSDEILKVLVDGSRGDMRAAINRLQVASSQLDSGLEQANVKKSFDAWKAVDISVMMGYATRGNLSGASKEIDKMLLDGIDCQEILSAFSDEIITTDVFDVKAKGDILGMIAEANYRIEMGSSERIQFNAILSAMAANIFRKTAAEHTNKVPTKQTVEELAAQGPSRKSSIESLDNVDVKPTSAKLPFRR